MTLGEEALTWLLSEARDVDGPLTWTDDPTLYSGDAGVVLALLEAHRHLGGTRWGDAALRGARGLSETEESGLYFGTTGVAFALRAVARVLDDDVSGREADQLLDVVRDRVDGERWNDQFELLSGNAGIAVGALAAGDPDLALLAVTPYLRTTEVTVAGLRWEGRQGRDVRMHHIAHGTLGIVLALAEVGHATGRADLVELALAGAADVVSRDEAGPDGFLVAHSDPPHPNPRVERYNLGWCHGPTGDATVFRRLATITGDPAWTALAQRCWHTVVRSGLPHRLRPGFWDNNGSCCGTAGVLAVACDLGDLDFAAVLVEDLQLRATRDDAGARWSNVEHRDIPSRLAPQHGWAMGNAGIGRELLRYERIVAGRDPAYAVPWPH